jgi:hypothetical protein
MYWMTKFCFWIIGQFLVIAVFAQTSIPSSMILVTGKVKKERSFTLADIRSLQIQELGNLNTSCSPRRKEESKNVKVVLLRSLLDSVRFDAELPRMLNQYYFKFVATDGYTLVYSFNEIYNTETGNHLFVVVEKDGKSIEEIENRILILTTSDLKPGARNMKHLEKIVVCQAE